MKSLVLKAPYDFQYEDREIPTPAVDEVLVKVQAVCICGSDSGAIKGTHGMFTYPRVMGHEVAGIVERVGENVNGFKAGDKVCLMPTVTCGECKACKKGKTNACTQLNIIGVHRDGGLEEYLCANQENWLKIDLDLSAAEIATIEPLTIGAHAVDRMSPDKGDQILIIGAGPIGASCAVSALSYGAEVYLSDTNDDRLKYIREHFGLKTFNVTDPEYQNKLMEVTDNKMFDGVIDTTAFAGSMQDTWKLICNGGKIVFVGIAGKELVIDGPGFHSKETSLYVSRNSVKSDYDRILKLIAEKKIDPKAFISHEVTFDKAAETLNTWIDPKTGVFKGVVIF